MDEHQVRLDTGSSMQEEEPVRPAGERPPPGGPLAVPPQSAWGSNRRRRRRPFGVYAIVVLFFLQSLAYGLLAVAAWEGQSMALRERAVAFIGGSLLGLLTLSIVIGLLLLRRAALVAAIILQGASLSVSIWGYFHSNASLVTSALGAATVFYLNQRQVQAAFRRRGSAGGAPPLASGTDAGGDLGGAASPPSSAGS